VAGDPVGCVVHSGEGGEIPRRDLAPVAAIHEVRELPAVCADHLTAGYGSVPVISDVSVRADAGSIVAVVGPNGAGKSTLLKAMFGLIRATEGTVMIGAQDVTGWPPYRIAQCGMAYVPQVDNVFPSMTIVENLEMGAFMRRGDIRPRIDTVFSMFPDLAAARGRKAITLSGGQRTMLAMARGLMLDPKVLLLDEPTAGLSPPNVAVVWRQVQRIAAEGTAVFVVEQNVDLAIANAHWVYVMTAGQNAIDGPADRIGQHDLAALFLAKGVGQQHD